MAEWRSAQWITILLLYFFVYFLTLWSIQSAAVDTQMQGSSFSFSSGFSTEIDKYDPNDLLCTGETNATDYHYIIPKWTLNCAKLGFNDEISRYLCNNMSGCEWQNYTDLFGFYAQAPKCKGEVNTTAMQIDISSNKAVCLFSNFTKNISNCIMLGCSWSNATEYYSQKFNINSPWGLYSSVTDTIALMTGFRVNIGLGQLGFIFVFFFTYLPTILLLLALYFAVR